MSGVPPSAPQLASELTESLDFDPDGLREKYRQERDKRLLARGVHQYRAPDGDFKHYVEDPYVAEPIEREPLSDLVDVAIIGGGFGGTLAGYHLRQAGIESIRVIEKGGDFGGVWYWNRYPGVECDVESYVYLPLLEETGFMPPKKFIEGQHIREYIQSVARRAGLYQGACLQTEVTALEWNDAQGHWLIRTNRQDEMRARFVVHTNGTLSRPKLPGIPGIEQFAGHTFHSSRWDFDYTGGDVHGEMDRLSEKTVGIVGTGATSIQCVPHLAEAAKHLYVFQRTPSSVDVRDDGPTDPQWFGSQPAGWHRRRRDNFNALLSGVPLEEDLVEDGWTEVGRMIRDMLSAVQDQSLSPEQLAQMSELADFRKMEQIRARVDEMVKDPEVAQRLKPWYRQMCKRPTAHNSYLSTFNRDNVTLVDTDGQGIQAMNAQGIVVKGRTWPLDCLIFSTGFETGTIYTRRSGYDIVGQQGIELSQAWADGVSTLHGVSSRGFPNSYILSNFQSGFTINFTHTLDEEARHVAYIIGHALDNELHSIQPSAEAERAWCAEIESMAGAFDDFFDACTPGYYNDEGHVRDRPRRNNWYGGGSIAFFDLIKAWREQGELVGMEIRHRP